MDERCQPENGKAYSGDGSHLPVDAVYWEQVAQRERLWLCNVSFFEPAAHDQLQFTFLNETLRVDLTRRGLLRFQEKAWRVSDDPLLTLATVMYLKNVQAVYPLGRDLVGVKDLREGHFFTGPHELRTAPLLQRFGNDPTGFRKAASMLCAEPMDMADAAFQLLPFPRVPLYFLLWAGDAEFEPRLQVLFDRSIEQCLAADAIWALVNRVVLAFAS